ncbi:AAA family ATPase [Burkholderia multivorans]|nr:DUF4435 domain-containing protein [Burkholderia multivorans]MBU9581388.1 AAA family ATPase [Burkholderia multivorans]
MSRSLLLPQRHLDCHGRITAPTECTSIDVEHSIVIVGANGAGKTRLGTWLDLQSPQRQLTFRISAQKSLSMPASGNISARNLAMNDLVYGATEATPDQLDFYKMHRRWTGEKSAIHSLSDFPKLLNYLFSDHAEEASAFLNAALDGAAPDKPPVTKISKLRKLWHELMPHRELIIGSADIKTKAAGSDSEYLCSDMSDGERVVFYLIGQCLSAPSGALIVIDEPEIHLHKSLQAPLWDAVERLRDDCTFVYITHDVDFAASKADAQKVWLKSFDGHAWDWEIISEVEGLPEDLLLEIIGSRKPTVFVEGENGSFDIQLYRTLLPGFLVMPRGSCQRVIDEVRALRSNAQFHHLEIYGVIDRDRRGDQEVAALERDNVFVLDVAEVENLFCTPEILGLCSMRLARDVDADLQTAIDDAFRRLRAELETQISMRVAAEIKFKLNCFDDKAKGSDALSAALRSLTSSIDVGALYADAAAIFERLMTDQDYKALLKYYNRKSLSSQIGAKLGLANKELPQLVVRLAAGTEVDAVRDALRPYFGSFGDRVGRA